MSLVRSTIVYTAAQAVLLVVGLASSIVIARFLGPEGRGVLALVALLATTATLLATFGFGSSYAFLVGKRTFPAASLVGSAVVASSVLGLATVVALLVASGPLLSSVLQGVTFWEYVV